MYILNESGTEHVRNKIYVKMCNSSILIMYAMKILLFGWEFRKSLFKRVSAIINK